jgi:hypothetical protein
MAFVPPVVRAGSKWVAARGAPTLVVDLDETLLYRARGLADALLMYGLPARLSAACVGVPYAGALGALHELARHFRVVALTARWSAGAGHTHAWLDAHGLGGLPVVVARRPHPGDASRVAFKADAIEWLRGAGWAPLAGVGDRPSDCAAYLAAGLHACVVAHAPPGGGGGDEAVWRALRGAAERVREGEAAARGGDGAAHSTAARAGRAGSAQPAPPAAAAAAAGQQRQRAPPHAVFFTDCGAVHAAAAAAAVAAAGADAAARGHAQGRGEGEAGEVLLGHGVGRIRLHVPPPRRCPRRLEEEPADEAGEEEAGGWPPPVWHEDQLLGHLRRLAAAESG